ncbi:hypothetical protein [Paraburkholderia largidicola]|uniref:Uncharacterized protein n=1 Tax=Paraburkholderia largidicola TaxID=3014751 RepID=A0A7I8C4E9_9BURK|nr:hypothetical protein [Paraburkholderia sp. PGU16]BCF95369.1 hypothetical protein PPGU16_84360 [Paraburkholderia sp. PGU16]
MKIRSMKIRSGSAQTAQDVLHGVLGITLTCLFGWALWAIASPIFGPLIERLGQSPLTVLSAISIGICGIVTIAFALHIVSIAGHAAKVIARWIVPVPARTRQ